MPDMTAQNVERYSQVIKYLRANDQRYTAELAELHSPTARGAGYVCEGCDQDTIRYLDMDFTDLSPDWPCRTAQMMLLGIDMGLAEKDRWRCARCGSDQWVAASLTGPVEYGGRAIRQCIPCGHYSNDPVS